MNYSYAQTLCYLEYFKKSLHFYKFCVYILRSIFIRAWCELDFAKTETAIEQSLFCRIIKYTQKSAMRMKKSRDV